MGFSYSKRNCVERPIKIFNILADETCDIYISRIEQKKMSLCVRYIDNGFIKEDFLEFVPIYDASGKGIAYTIRREIGKLGLEIENLIGQGHDGVSAMSGCKVVSKSY